LSANRDAPRSGYFAVAAEAARTADAKQARRIRGPLPWCWMVIRLLAAAASAMGPADATRLGASATTRWLPSWRTGPGLGVSLVWPKPTERSGEVGGRRPDLKTMGGALALVLTCVTIAANSLFICNERSGASSEEAEFQQHVGASLAPQSEP